MDYEEEHRQEQEQEHEEGRRTCIQRIETMRPTEENVRSYNGRQSPSVKT